MFALVTLMLFATPAGAAAPSTHVSQNVSSPASPLVSSTMDFSITANPTSLTIPPGATQSSVITVTSLNGFVGTIYLAAFSYPLSVSLGGTSLILSSPGLASTVLTVTAPSTMSPANETIFVEASGGCALVHFTDVSARVTGPDFVVSAEKSHLTIAQGGSDTSKVNLASRNGFTGAVTLGSFSSLTNSLLPASVTLSSGGVGSSTLSVSAPLTTEPGNYSVFVTASSGKLLHDVSVDVTVTGPTFAMSAHQEFLTLLAGGATNSSTITISPSGGYTGTVSLTAGPTSLPPGLTISLDKPSVSLPPVGTATLTVGAPLATKAGIYLVDVSGTDGTITKSTSVLVTVKGPDFDISPDPSFLILVAGGASCTSTISLSPLNGFVGSVGLTLKADPSLTTSLSTATVAVPGTSTLTVSAPLNTKPGFYSVGVNGTSTSPPKTHTTFVSVYVIGPDFGLSANPPDLTVTAGGSATTSLISMMAEFGFTGTVGLVASSFDPGIMTGLSTSSISGSLTSTLSVTATAGTVPGSYYSVEVNGTSGVLTHSIFVPVTVVGPDFAISSNPTSIAINAGTPTTSTITITPTLGFNSPVDLNAFASSANLNASISPTPVTSPGYTAILNVNSTIPGVYTVDVFASSGGLFHDLSIPVTVVGPDFSLSASPAILTIAAGSSKTSTVTVGPLNGFTGSVALTALGATGITPSLSPTSITSPQTSTLTITVDPTASPGPYTVDVQGTSGKLVHDTLVTVNVASFSLTATSNALTIDQGASQSTTVNVAAVNGFTGTVQLAFLGQTGITATITPASITNSGPATVNIAVGNTVSPGTYAVNVTGTSGLLSQKATITVTVPIPDFTISGPTTVSCSVSTSCPATITITYLNGLSGTVSFTVSSSTPAGLACTAPTSVIGTGPTILSCSSTTVGDYSVIVTGTNGALHHDSGPITYHVVPAQDFTISAGATSPAAILTGSSGSAAITVGPVGGFAGPVSFSSSTSSPAGLSCQPIPNWAGAGTATLTCTATVAGDYTVTVTGTATIGGTLVYHTTSVISFHVVGFSIAASPTTVAVNTNAAGTSTITIAKLNQFSGVVSLSANNSACSFTPATVTGSGSSALSCTFTTAGTRTITVTASSGSLSLVATVTFTVTAVTTPNFTIAATTPASFASGDSGTSTVTLTAQNGFYSNVDLTYTVSPGSGLSVSFNPNSFVYGSGSSTATFSSSTPGTYTVTITGTSGSLSNSAMITVTVTAAPQPAATASNTILGLDPTIFYALIGVIVAIVIIGSTVVVIRGKKPKATP